MEFLQTLRDANVTFASSVSALAVGLFGLVLWGVPLGLYVAALVAETERTEVRNVWYAIVAIHVATGLLVDVEAVWTRGTFWPLQTVIIGGATFITLTLPALFGYYLARDASSSQVVLTACALGFACLANAVMVSILFEYFHRRGAAAVAAVARPRTAVARGAASV